MDNVYYFKKVFGIKRVHSTFLQTHKVGNNGIKANFVFLHVCSFPHYLDLNVLVSVNLDGSWLVCITFQGCRLYWTF